MKKILKKVAISFALLSSLVSCGGESSSDKSFSQVGSLTEKTLYDGETKKGVEKQSEVWGNEEKCVILRLTFSQTTGEDVTLNVKDFKMTIGSTDYTPSNLFKKKQISHEVGDTTKETYTETYTYANQSINEALTGITVSSGRSNNWTYYVQFDGLTSIPTSSFIVSYQSYELKAYDENYFSDINSYYALGEDTNLFAYYGDSGKTFKEESLGTRVITYKNVNEVNFKNTYKVIYVELSGSIDSGNISIKASDFSLKNGENYIPATSFMVMETDITTISGLSTVTYTVSSSTTGTIEVGQVFSANLYFGSDANVTSSMPLYYQSKALNVISK